MPEFFTSRNKVASGDAAFTVLKNTKIKAPRVHQYERHGNNYIYVQLCDGESAELTRGVLEVAAKRDWDLEDGEPLSRVKASNYYSQLFDQLDDRQKEKLTYLGRKLEIYENGIEAIQAEFESITV